MVGIGRMYVCICNALSEKKVREAARHNRGVSSAAEIFRSLGAVPDCGKCASHALDVFRDESARHSTS